MFRNPVKSAPGETSETIVTSGVICPVCEGREVNSLGKLPDRYWFAGKRLEAPLSGGSLYRCACCFLKFRYPAQTEDMYQRFYNNSLTTMWASETSRPDWEKIKNYVQQAFPQGARVLDFGCYSGGLLSSLGAHYRKHGIEINQSAAKVAMERNHLIVWKSLDDVPIGMKFDLIIASDVVEHVLNPKLLIDNLMKLLEKDGALIITTGDADNYLWNFFGANWWYCFYSEHISFISKRWLEHYYKNMILHIENFYYFRPKINRLIIDWALTVFYGIVPRIYLCLGIYLKKIIRRGGDVGPMGVGLSPDHMLVVLANKGKPF